MSCKDKIKYTCGTKLNARCVDYEGEIFDCSELPECSKHSVHDVIEDIQEFLDKTCEKLNLDEIDTQCSSVELSTVGAYINDLYSKICELKEALPQDKCQDLGDTSIECLNLDFSCLIPDDPCGDAEPKTVKDFFQFLIDKQCEQLD